MNHFYENISGWFNYQDLYTKVINLLPDNSHIVEIGAWKGKSTAYLVVEALNSNKNIRIDVVDDWLGGGDIASNYEADEEYKNNNGDIFELFLKNINPVLHKINIVRKLSKDASKCYTDKSLDFVFIDANHSYENVKEDIELWLPKIKKYGIIAGHDYNIWQGVNKAVDEKFEKFEIMKTSWIVQL